MKKILIFSKYLVKTKWYFDLNFCIGSDIVKNCRIDPLYTIYFLKIKNVLINLKPTSWGIHFDVLPQGCLEEWGWGKTPAPPWKMIHPRIVVWWFMINGLMGWIQDNMHIFGHLRSQGSLLSRLGMGYIKVNILYKIYKFLRGSFIY